MRHDGFMSRPNCIGVPGGKMDLARRDGVAHSRRAAARASMASGWSWTHRGSANQV